MTFFLELSLVHHISRETWLLTIVVSRGCQNIQFPRKSIISLPKRVLMQWFLYENRYNWSSTSLSEEAFLNLHIIDLEFRCNIKHSWANRIYVRTREEEAAKLRISFSSSLHTKVYKLLIGFYRMYAERLKKRLGLLLLFVRSTFHICYP